MSKFSDIPYFIFNKFLNDTFINKDVPSTGRESSFLDIVSLKSPYFKAYIKRKEGYKKIYCFPSVKQFQERERDELDNIYLTFLAGDVETYSTLTSSTSSWNINHNLGYEPLYLQINNIPNILPLTVSNTINNLNLTFSEDCSGTVSLFYVQFGDEFYLKKDDEFFEWLKINNNSDLLKYVNINKKYLYLGKLEPTNKLKYSSEWYIKHYNIKNFALNSMPEVNKTYLNEMIIRYFFDKIYSKNHNAIDNLKSLIDADECPIEHLEYLAKFTNLDIKNYNLDDDTTRALVKSSIYLLKKKGTYSALENLFDLILPEISNILTIYERWHPKKVITNNLNPSDYFIDFPWKQFYEDIDSNLMNTKNIDFIFNDNLPWVLCSLVTLDLETNLQEVHKMQQKSSYWLIYTKNEYNNIQLYCTDIDKKKILPKNIEKIDKRFFKIYFKNEIDGYVFINGDVINV